VDDADPIHNETMSLTTAPLRSRLNPFDPGVLEDPYPTYRELRDAGPVCRVAPTGWGITRYSDVAALLRDPRVSHAFPKSDPRFSVADNSAAELARRIMLTKEATDHSRIRRLVQPAFSPARVRGLREEIGRQVDERLAEGVERGHLDLVGDLALPLAVSTVCALIGLPTDARDEIARRSADLSRAFTPFAMPEESRGAADDALVWLRSIVTSLLAERRRSPRADLLTSMLGGTDGEALSLEEAVDNIVFICFTGYETTVNMIANGCAALLRFPDQMARLRAEPSLVANAVEEFLRFEAPSQFAAGITSEAVEVGDRTIKPGRVVFLLLGSANRDERRFDHPDRLDVGRSPIPHVSFGGGAHHCIGAALGRAEGAVVFDRLLRRTSRMEAAGPTVRAPNASMRAFAHIPAQLSGPVT